MLIKCRECQREISSEASRCPLCGASKYPTWRRVLRVLFYLVSIPILLILLRELACLMMAK
jgi:predicted amidophosphoribosyltransferase